MSLRRKSLCILGGYLLGYPLFARADSQIGACATLSSLAGKISDCSQNRFLVQAGKNCLDAISLEIKSKQAILAQRMAVTGASGTASQVAKITDNSQNLSDTESTLTQLEAEAARARNEMARSTEGLALPGPISKRVAARLHLEPFLSKFSCYSDGNVTMAKEESLLDRSIWELKLSILSARKLRGIDARNVEKLNAGSFGNKILDRAPAQASPRPSVPGGSSAPNASDITGTKKTGQPE